MRTLIALNVAVLAFVAGYLLIVDAQRATRRLLARRQPGRRPCGVNDDRRL